MQSPASTSGRDAQIQVVRDEFSALRRKLFEMVEAAGMWPGQEDGFKKVIRTVTYDSQAAVEAALRRGGNHARLTSH